MTHRDHFFAVLEGKKPGAMPFFPDITDWYTSQRTPRGEEKKFGAAEFIPDRDAFHQQSGTMPARYHDFTLFDFYREFHWGFPVHISNWFDVEYSGGVEKITRIEGRERIVRLITPKGALRHVDWLAADGTWAPHEHYVKTLKDLDVMRVVVDNTRFVPRYENVDSIMREMGEQGFGDIVIFRSPFGKLVHQYIGFEQVIYMLFDDPGNIHDFLKLQEKKDMELVHLAAAAPERLVIISDHADENLISPKQYEDYCIPFYQKACAVLHQAGKFVSTHLDGNFKGYFPLLHKTGFDLLDGCTPAPMFNYELEELARAMPEGMKAFCGVPSSLFCQKLPIQKILTFGDRVQKALQGRGILNVGDILPPDGDIEQVIALGRHIQGSL
jgi:uroporphyrinogen-III decarboxylase